MEVALLPPETLFDNPLDDREICRVARFGKTLCICTTDKVQLFPRSLYPVGPQNGARYALVKRGAGCLGARLHQGTAYVEKLVFTERLILFHVQEFGHKARLLRAESSLFAKSIHLLLVDPRFCSELT